MNFVFGILNYVVYARNRKTTPNVYMVDTWQDKELLNTVLKRYWKARDLIRPESSDVQTDDLFSLVKAAAAKSDSKQVEELLHKALHDNLDDVYFYETVAEYYYSQPDGVKYGALSQAYLLVLNTMIERRYDDGKYLLGRADYYKKYEDYEAARDDYKALLNIYPDDLWFPYAISAVYRKQDMRDASVAYLKNIKENAPKNQAR
jgi:tetratricopeptide (TPR) repeat protein